jgi:hypothetical protein
LLQVIGQKVLLTPPRLRGLFKGCCRRVPQRCRGWSDLTDKAVLSSGEDKRQQFDEAFVEGLLSSCRRDFHSAGEQLGLARLRSHSESESAFQPGIDGWSTRSVYGFVVTNEQPTIQGNRVL